MITAIEGPPLAKSSHFRPAGQKFLDNPICLVKGGALVSVLFDYSQCGGSASGHCCYTFCLKYVARYEDQNLKSDLKLLKIREIDLDEYMNSLRMTCLGNFSMTTLKCVKDGALVSVLHDYSQQLLLSQLMKRSAEQWQEK